MYLHVKVEDLKRWIEDILVHLILFNLECTCDYTDGNLYVNRSTKLRTYKSDG